MKRLFDLLMSALALVILFPIFVFIALFIILDSKGGAFYKQKRVGLYEKPFWLYKFRTMGKNADKNGQITIGAKDSRITEIGYWLRKYKLDELPQLFNVLKGDMSLVGPRPEVPEYVALYNVEHKEIFKVKPGITDYASIEFINENEILGNSEDPLKTYVDEIMPKKLALNKKYINEVGFFTDLKIILLTLRKIL